MMIREPFAAGRFYSRDPQRCLADLKACLAAAGQSAKDGEAFQGEHIIGGVVPHAGWSYSGSVAARVFNEIAQRQHPAAIIIFGAIHVSHGAVPTLFPSGGWETPLGLAGVDDRLGRRLHGQTGLLEIDAHAHDDEHSIEVEVPFIQYLMPNTLIVPIMVPVNDKAVGLGEAVGRTCRIYGVQAVFLCSTDLTHYGPRFGFSPQGVGPAGLNWARNVNDRRMIDLMLAMRAGDAVGESLANYNACGGGAIAATLAACKAYGAKQATLLEHTTSAEVDVTRGEQASSDAVGYTGIVIE